MRLVRPFSSLYWYIQDRRPDLSARRPKPLQLASQKNFSPCPGVQCMVRMFAFVKAPATRPLAGVGCENRRPAWKQCGSRSDGGR
jgi:hypothetical protein